MDFNGDFNGKLINWSLQDIVMAIKKDGKVTIRNFGTFKIKERRARIVHNPQTGQKYTVDAKNILVFRQSKNILKIIND